MDRAKVDSSMIRSIGYDEDNLILEIEFNSGNIYQYFDVQKDEFDGIISASSVGRYFLNNIDESYEFIQIY